MEFDLHSALQAYEHTLRADPYNVSALCEIGKALNQFKRPQEARKCYKAAVEALKRAIRAGDVDAALIFETTIFHAFVRTGDNEQHYYRCFSDWREDMARLGRRSGRPADARADPNRIAFFLHTGFVLGHTEVLFKILENIPRARRAALTLRIYVLSDYAQSFMARAQKTGVEVVLVAECLPRGSGNSPYARFLYLRDRLRQDEMGVCVWVSVPTLAAFAFAMRLAPVQIFWSLRFHPITGPYIDGYITWGDKSEKTRRYGNQEWEVVPVPFAVDDSLPEPSEIERLRRLYPVSVLLGTLAREEKIDSAPFLQAVASILTANPQAGFLWTGRIALPSITEFFSAAGIAERCHFVGWVDTKLYAAALDIFLETFPHGFGITSYRALAAGVALLSYLGPYTSFGQHFWHSAHTPDTDGVVPQRPRLNAPDEYAILCARDTEEYVALAGRLINDPAWRAEVGARGQAFFREEQGNNVVYAERFFAAVIRIAAAKLGNSAPGSPAAPPTIIE